MNSADAIPVIVAIGEMVDRPQNPLDALEPVAAMAKALHLAEQDASGIALDEIGSIDLVGQITWRYADPVGLLCDRLGISPARAVNASMGGETPVRLVHEAALRISRGECRVCAIVGGEAMYARGKAEGAGVPLDWTAQVSQEKVPVLAGSRLAIRDASRRIGASSPRHLYALYENAFQARLGQSPCDGIQQAAELWARYALIAADNPFAWNRQAMSADEIAHVGPGNRMIAWPYPKLMMANPNVNQSSAIILTSLAHARLAGIPEDRLVHIWGGAAAAEPGDYLMRDRYDHSVAQNAVLRKAVEIAGGRADGFDHVELYSCFPIVPKMALEQIRLPKGVEPTVTGGITFFGGPMNNYMSHATCAMVRRIRERGGTGVLYGQGGFVDKHHALVISSEPPPTALDAGFSVQEEADRARGAIPLVVEGYDGPAEIETWTVLYERNGPTTGIVIARTPQGARLLAAVEPDDEATIAVLTDIGQSAAGTAGHVKCDIDGVLRWSISRDAADLRPQLQSAERHEGALDFAEKIGPRWQGGVGQDL